MQATITVSDAAKQTALQRALEAYNARNPAVTPEEFIQKLVDHELDGLVASLLVPDVTKLAFLNRFTAEERIGIRAAAAQSPAIADYLAMLDAAQDVSLIDPRTITGAQALEAAGLISAGRAAQILAL